MKKQIIFILLTTLISGCSLFQSKPQNEYCLDFEQVKIFQVVPEGALALQCTKENACSVWNQVVFLPNMKDYDYYDGLIIQFPKDRCPIQTNVYRYVSNDSYMNTVPVIRLGYKNEAKTETELQQQLDGIYNDLFYMCQDKHRLHRQKKNYQFCQCYAKTMVETFVDAKLEIQFADDMSDIYQRNIQKACGQYME